MTATTNFQSTINIDFNTSSASSYSKMYKQTESDSNRYFKIYERPSRIKIQIGTSTSNKIQEYPTRWLKFKSYPWVIEMFTNANEIVDVKTLLPYYTYIHDGLLLHNYQMCDDILNELEVTNSSDVLLVGLLRLTFTWKNHLSSWQKILYKVEYVLNMRGLDSKKLLSGLL